MLVRLTLGPSVPEIELATVMRATGSSAVPASPTTSCAARYRQGLPQPTAKKNATSAARHAGSGFPAKPSTAPYVARTDVGTIGSGARPHATLEPQPNRSDPSASEQAELAL